MQSLLYELNCRKEELIKIIKKAEAVIEQAPSGRIQKIICHGNRQYYQRKVEEKKLMYISKKNNIKLIDGLLNKEYAQQVRDKAYDELKVICLYLSNYEDNNVESIYETYIEEDKSHILPIAVSDKYLLEKWNSEKYHKNDYYPEKLIYETKCGELVRSKSEREIANLYYEMGIPYRYEAEIQFADGRRRYPDFTLLDIKNRRLIYHEHLGLLDDASYRKENLQKLREYGSENIYLGKNLFITYEAIGNPLDLNEVRRMVEEIMK